MSWFYLPTNFTNNKALVLFAHEFHEYTRITKRLDNEFNNSPNKFGSALAYAKICEISATDKVAILPVERD